MNEPITLTLTTDELLAVLQVMGASGMNGLGEPLAGLSEREQAARLNAGAETLLNRGLCEISNDQLVMDSTLVAFVGTSLIPDATLLLSFVQPDGTSEPHYFHATSELMVEHQGPRPGIQLFSHIPDQAALDGRLAALLAPLAMDRERASRPEQGTISDAALNEALVAVRGKDTRKAQQLLQRAGWSAPSVEAFTTDIANAPSWVGMVGWGLRNETPSGGSSVLVFAGADRYWLFQPNASGDTLTVTCPNGATCANALAALAAHLK